jgi:hypothetical protein
MDSLPIIEIPSTPAQKPENTTAFDAMPRRDRRRIALAAAKRAKIEPKMAWLQLSRPNPIMRRFTITTINGKQVVDMRLGEFRDGVPQQRSQASRR